METKPIDVLTIGESMVLFQPANSERISFSSLFSASVGGAESNVATALSRLGLSTKWVSHLGDDPFAKIILSALAGEGVDITDVKLLENEKTAVFFKEKSIFDDPYVYYYRHESASSKITTDDIKDSWFKNAEHLHLTGITLALGKGAREFVKGVMLKAKAFGMSISFDPNIRLKLQGKDFWRESVLELLPLVDVFMPGQDEAALLFGGLSDEDLIKTSLTYGPKITIIKLGKEGSLTGYNNHLHREPAITVDGTIDTIGAGDAFAAGFLSFLLKNDFKNEHQDWMEMIPTAAKRASVMGALATTYKGDWEGNPTLKELDHFMNGTQVNFR